MYVSRYSYVHCTLSHLRNSQNIASLGLVCLMIPYHLFIYLHENGTTNHTSTLDIQLFKFTLHLPGYV